MKLGCWGHEAHRLRLRHTHSKLHAHLDSIHNVKREDTCECVMRSVSRVDGVVDQNVI